MADVFISYHEKSAGDIAAKIADALEEAGISCWYAKRDIPLGGDFARYIPPQIDACKVFLPILNEGVYQSKHIENEVGLAFGRLNHREEITIIPVEVGDFKRESWVKYYLIHTQSVKIPCLDETHIQEIIQKIATALDHKTVNETPKTHLIEISPITAITLTFAVVFMIVIGIITAYLYAHPLKIPFFILFLVFITRVIRSFLDLLN